MFSVELLSKPTRLLLTTFCSSTPPAAEQGTLAAGPLPRTDPAGSAKRLCFSHIYERWTWNSYCGFLHFVKTGGFQPVRFHQFTFTGCRTPLSKCISCCASLRGSARGFALQGRRCSRSSGGSAAPRKSTQQGWGFVVGSQGKLIWEGRE